MNPLVRCDPSAPRTVLAMGLSLLALGGCASYGGGNFNYAANPDLQTVMLYSGTPSPVGVRVGEVETTARGGSGCSDLGNTAIRELLADAKQLGGIGVKDVQFRGRSRWVGQIVCKDGTFGRSVDVRGVAYHLGDLVPMPQPVSMPVPKEMRSQFTEVAILSVAAQEPIPDWVTTYIQPVSHPLEALKVTWMETHKSRGWYPVSRASGRIEVGYQQDQFELRVGVDYTKTEITGRILTSRNLGQTTTVISAEGRKWFREFMARTESALTDLAARR